MKTILASSLLSRASALVLILTALVLPGADLSAESEWQKWSTTADLWYQSRCAPISVAPGTYLWEVRFQNRGSCMLPFQWKFTGDLVDSLIRIPPGQTTGWYTCGQYCERRNCQSDVPGALRGTVWFPTISYFRASPGSITAGMATRLEWDTAWGTTAEIIGIGTVGLSGSRSVSPTVSTSYILSLSNGCTSIRQSVDVIVNSACQRPSIELEPQGQTVVAGGSYNLSVSAKGTAPLSYQWYNGSSGDMSRPVGSNSNTISGSAQSTTPYWVRITNSCGSVFSRTATVVVSSSCTPPSITSHPGSRTISSGNSAALSVAASGTAPFAYQWFEGASGDTARPVGSNSPNFTTPALNSSATYWVRVQNACGVIDSSGAVVSIGSMGTCSADANTLCLNDNRFRVSVTWSASSQSGAGRAVPLTNDTGYFWFFNSENVELVVKALDGRPVNGRWWIFFGALSNVEYRLQVTDTQTGGSKTYSNPSGRFASVGDTVAFSIDPLPALAAPRQSMTESSGQDLPAMKSTVRPLATCSPNDKTLCLNGNRFQVRASWRAQNQSGQGTAVRLTADTGYFWFFNSANVELVLKALDGRAVNGNWWIFYGALSDVEYTIEVIDMVTGVIRNYRNAPGQFASVGDTDAFSGGPTGGGESIIGAYSAGAGASTQNANHCAGGDWSPSPATADRQSVVAISREGNTYFLSMDGAGGAQLPRLKYALALVSSDEIAGRYQFSGAQSPTGWGPWCDNGIYAPSAAEGTIVIAKSGNRSTLSGTLTFVSTWPCAVGSGECRTVYRDIYNLAHVK